MYLRAGGKMTEQGGGQKVKNISEAARLLDR